MFLNLSGAELYNTQIRYSNNNIEYNGCDFSFNLIIHLSFIQIVKYINTKNI